MTRITVLPHDEICPEGANFEVEPGVSLCDAMLGNHIDIEHGPGGWIWILG
jgi:2Fe-2S ferredoxin